MANYFVSYFLIALTINLQFIAKQSNFNDVYALNQNNQEERAINRVFELLEACSSWGDIVTASKEDKDRAMSYLTRISSQDPLIVRQAIKKYLGINSKESHSIENNSLSVKEALDRYKSSEGIASYNLSQPSPDVSRIFLLNRFMFNVPSEVMMPVPVFGGWEGVPHRDGKINLLWPFSIAADGSIELTGKPIMYVGQRYDAIGEFDYFYHAYGKRNFQNGNK